MSSFVIHSRDSHSRAGRALSGLAFDDERLIATRIDDAGPDSAVVQDFDPGRDVFYLLPAPLTTEQLEHEVEIHFPRSLLERTSSRPLASTVGDAVLIQVVEGNSPYISPLAALAQILNSTGPVNSGILQAAGGGMLFLHRAGDIIRARASRHSISTFLAMSKAERTLLFPGFEANELILTGPDIEGLDHVGLDPLVLSRKITIDDIKTVLDITEDAEAMMSRAPHRYALVAGAAAVYSAIRREARMLAS